MKSTIGVEFVEGGGGYDWLLAPVCVVVKADEWDFREEWASNSREAHFRQADKGAGSRQVRGPRQASKRQWRRRRALRTSSPNRRSGGEARSRKALEGQCREFPGCVTR